MSDKPEASASRDEGTRTPCPRCGARETVLGTETSWYVYLRCPACCEVWAFPERRVIRRRGGAPTADPRGSAAQDST